MEKFHYGHEEEITAFDENNTEDSFQMLNLEKSRTLAERHSLEKPGENIRSAMDISAILKDGMDWKEIMDLIERGGFDGVNIGTDQLESVADARNLKERLEKQNSEVYSFHGSLDPYFIGLAEEPNGEIINHDFEIADALDESDWVPINYDLVGADLPSINEFQEGVVLSEIHEKQRKALSEKGIETEKDLIDSVVKFVAENRPEGARRPAVFETRQSIIAESPEITEENLQHIVDTCRKHFKDDHEWGITIDVGHIMGALPREKGIENITAMKEEIERTMGVLEKYAKHIKMVHASGTVTSHTSASYKLAEREGMDVEAVKAWSMHQAIDNEFIVEMVKRIREMKGSDPFIETSEVRPIHSAAKTFGKTLNFNKEKSEEVYREQVVLQGEILGYNKQ